MGVVGVPFSIFYEVGLAGNKEEYVGCSIKLYKVVGGNRDNQGFGAPPQGSRYI